MNVRAASPDDKALLLELVEEFEAGLPPLPYAEDGVDEDWQRLEARMREGVVLVVEDEGRAVGFTSADFGKHGPTTVFVVDLYVREAAREHGAAKALLAGVADAARARGCTHLLLEVDSGNLEAQTVYRRLGFEEGAKILRVELPALESRLAERRGEGFGAVHVQTDDAGSVERAVEQFMPRVGRSSGWSVDPAANGWTRVRFEPFDRDVQTRLARELSDRSGAVVASLAVEDGTVVRFLLYERGRMVDEYLSVPEYYSPLPPGDALALRANPTVVARLTGADPARVRAVARTADSPSELPPARELYEQIAGVMGLRA